MRHPTQTLWPEPTGFPYHLFGTGRLRSHAITSTHCLAVAGSISVGACSLDEIPIPDAADLDIDRGPCTSDWDCPDGEVCYRREPWTEDGEVRRTCEQRCEGPDLLAPMPCDDGQMCVELVGELDGRKVCREST